MPKYNGYCLDTDEEELKHLSCKLPKWVKADGDAEIGESVGYPKCRAWGVDNFEIY